MASASSFQDHYIVLGIPQSATYDEIKIAFRRLARLHHPDKNGNTRASTVKIQQINAAWEVLGDSSTRSEYDRSRPAYNTSWDHPKPSPQSHSQPPPRSNNATEAEAKARAAKDEAEKRMESQRKRKQWLDFERTQEECIRQSHKQVKTMQTEMNDLEAKITKNKSTLAADVPYWWNVLPSLSRMLSDEEKDNLRRQILDAEAAMRIKRWLLDRETVRLSALKDELSKRKTLEVARLAAELQEEQHRERAAKAKAEAQQQRAEEAAKQRAAKAKADAEAQRQRAEEAAKQQAAWEKMQKEEEEARRRRAEVAAKQRAAKARVEAQRQHAEAQRQYAEARRRAEVVTKQRAAKAKADAEAQRQLLEQAVRLLADWEALRQEALRQEALRQIALRLEALRQEILQVEERIRKLRAFQEAIQRVAREQQVKAQNDAKKQRAQKTLSFSLWLTLLIGLYCFTASNWSVFA